MMKKVMVVLIMTVVALFVSGARAGVSVVMNSSFEHDGYINDINDQPPYRWPDVSAADAKFRGLVSESTDWTIHGGHYLVVYSYSFSVLNAGDEATVSQQVYLTDVNEIIFNVRLDTGSASHVWHTSQRTAFLKIDADVVWDSNSLAGAPGDIRGEYLDQVLVSYYTMWDLVRFDTHCGGFGYLAQDFARDCYIDELDLAVLAEQWLADVNEVYDLFEDGVFNFNDYDLFAEYWMANSDSNNWRDDNCYQAPLLDADFNDDGIINFVDFTILTGDWLDGSETADYIVLSGLFDEWLAKSWLYGL